MRLLRSPLGGFLEPVGTGSEVCSQAQLRGERSPLIGSQYIGKLGHGGGSNQSVVIHLGCSPSALFGGDQDDPGGTPGAINGSRGSILQHVHGFDVVGIHIVQRSADHTVDDHQRLGIRSHGAQTPQAQVVALVGVTSCLGDGKAGDLALHQLGGIGYLTLVEIFRFHTGHRTGDLFLFLGTITDHHDFVQGLDILDHGNVNGCLASHRDGLGGIANRRKYQDCVGTRNGYTVISVHIGHGTLGGTLDHNVYTGNGALQIGAHCTGHCSFLGKG